MSAPCGRVSAKTAAFVQIQRRQLFRAAAVVDVVKHASTSSMEGPSAETIVDALDAAYCLIDTVAAALEGLGAHTRE